MDRSEHIVFDKESFTEFKKKYEECPDGSTFIFQGKELYKAFAKYIIEYAEQKIVEELGLSKN